MYFCIISLCKFVDSNFLLCNTWTWCRMYWNFYLIDIFYCLLNWIFLNISPLQIWCWMICKTWIILGVVGVVVTECPSLFCGGLLATVIAMMWYQHIQLWSRMFQGGERFWKTHIVVLGCVATAITTNRSFARGVNLTHSNEISNTTKFQDFTRNILVSV